MSKSTVDSYQEIVQRAESEPLSRLLPSILTLARRLGDSDLEHWTRLEMGGYLHENPAMNNDIVVPEYRTVVGQHTDEYGRPLIIPDPKLHFINEERLRSGVAKLEHLAGSEDMIVIRAPGRNEIIRRNLDVEVTRFVFPPSAIVGVLSNIRYRLLDRLAEIQPDIDQMVLNKIKEQPNLDTTSAWHYTLITASVLAIVGSIIWFIVEQSFEPLIGFVAGVVGLVIYKSTSSRKLDIVISVALIILFFIGLAMIFCGR